MKGPEFLPLPQEQWPNGTPPPPQNMEHHQMKLAVSFLAVKAEDTVNPSSFSNWGRLIQVTARIRTLTEKIRLRRNGQEG